MYTNLNKIVVRKQHPTNFLYIHCDTKSSKKSTVKDTKMNLKAIQYADI